MYYYCNVLICTFEFDLYFWIFFYCVFFWKFYIERLLRYPYRLREAIKTIGSTDGLNKCYEQESGYPLLGFVSKENTAKRKIFDRYVITTCGPQGNRTALHRG